MHDIEPFYHWRDHYIASEDKRSPFYGRFYDEFHFTNKVYNYFIHPQWDEFGSSTLYMKILYADYEDGFAIFEMIGEWNDTLHNDIMYLKREVVDRMIPHGIRKFVVICENVLNFHGSDDCYYEEWYEDVRDDDGWIAFLNLFSHVEDEMSDTRLQHYVHFGEAFNEVIWRAVKPANLIHLLEQFILKPKRLHHG